MTLLQAINQFIENISVTDRQDESIQCSLDNLNGRLKEKGNDLFVLRTFTNGSYDRDTIIRPLNDVDIFAVLNLENWKDENENLPKPQKVLTRIKEFLNGLTEYKDKVKQDRPCVTLHLSDKNFDILPCFELATGGYLIPNFDLKSWTYSYPEQLSQALDTVHRLRGYKIKQVVKAIKYWNRDLEKLIPSYHIEEVTTEMFTTYNFTNWREAIEIWFNNAESYLLGSKFRSENDYANAIQNVQSANTSLKEAKINFDKGQEAEALQAWKEIFGRDFPTIDPEEAKSFSKAISEGALKISTAGILSTNSGHSMGASKGYHGGTF